MIQMGDDFSRLDNWSAPSTNKALSTVILSTEEDMQCDTTNSTGD
jgi:hypothetical protein